jgi:SAM-dependent methyltransferase
MTDSTRALSFGAVAANYDRYRPSYPAELVADVCALLPGRRVVEVGAGTGIATSRFAAHGLALTCVEPDPQMAAVLTAKFDGNDDVRVAVDTFEGWSAGRGPADPRYDGLICAQAWHWTAAGTRWRDAAAALTAGGLIALFWNQDVYADPAVPALLAAAYERYGVTDRAVASDEDEEPAGWPADELAAATGFTDHDLRIYRWDWTQSVVDHVARLNTISAHLILAADVREALTRDLVDSLTAHSGDQIALAMRTELALARRRP